MSSNKKLRAALVAVTAERNDLLGLRETLGSRCEHLEDELSKQQAAQASLKRERDALVEVKAEMAG